MLPLLLLLAIRLTPDSGGAEYRQPQLAVGQGIVGVAFGAGNSVYFASSRDSGTTFSQPTKVGETPALALGRHRGPRVVITPGAIVISAVVGKAGAQAGELTAWRSTDGGRTWTTGAVINDVPNAAREGLHGMSAGANGVIFATWLDLRSGPTELYGSRSSDGGLTWSRNRRVYQSPDGHICECCHPSVRIGPNGDVYAMWRNWLGGSRDMYVGVSRDGGETFRAQKLGDGTWPLNACPMDGGELAFDSRRAVWTVWRRDKSIFLARAGEKEVELGAGKDASLAFGTGDRSYVAWTSGSGIVAQLPGKPQPVRLAEEGAYVNLVGGETVFAAWESKGGIVVERLP